MTTPDRQTPPPDFGTPSTSVQGQDQWILLALNNLKTEISDAKHASASNAARIEVALTAIDGRLSKVEGKISRAIWTGGAAIATFGFLAAICYGLWNWVSPYVKIEFGPPTAEHERPKDPSIINKLP